MSCSKRQRDDPSPGEGEPNVKKLSLVTSLATMKVSTLEEMDANVLSFQHTKLKQRFELLRKQEADLRERIVQLENRQTQDDAILNVINRYWNQLNEDVRILLERFDAETSDECENKNESEETTSFLAQLATWDKQELDAKLASRVQVSTRAVAKIVQAFDRLQQRNEKMLKLFRGESTDNNTGEEKVTCSDESIKEANIQLEAENRNIQALNTALHEKYRTMSLQTKDLQERLTAQETKRDELQNQVDDLNWELNKMLEEKHKLIDHVAELEEKISKGCNRQRTSPASDDEGEITDKESDQLRYENMELQELANNRLVELERLHADHKKTLRDVQQLKLSVRRPPESIIVETPEFKCMQSKFSVLFNENIQLVKALEEAKFNLSTARVHHAKEAERIEAEAKRVENELSESMKVAEGTALERQQRYEDLRAEFQQSLESNHQVIPLNREMRELVKSLQCKNISLKKEVSLYRKKYMDTQNENTELKKRYGELEDTFKEDQEPSSSVKTEAGVKRRLDLEETPSENEIKKMRSDLKKSKNEQRELKLLLDMYKSASKEHRDKVELMAAERKCRQEMEECKDALKKLRESKTTDEAAMKRIQQLEDEVHSLQKQVTSLKQEEDMLISEMESTGEAYEEVQEQNTRLIQQLREKDDTNFQLMGERVKTKQKLDLMSQENQLLAGQVTNLKGRIEAQNKVVKILEEQEKHLHSAMSIAEKENIARDQALQLHKRKAIESSQSAADLKLHLDKYHSQMLEVQHILTEKTCAMEAQAFKTQRLQEELTRLKREVARLKKIENAGSTDKVMVEEIREYKETLTCPSCKINRKDAVLTKCFHVFCLDCLRTRYETRQRKCPKCNAAFGVNDFHRIYLS